MRKSDVRTESDLLSPARQRRALERWRADNKYRAEFYEDAEGRKSGRHEKGRPAWQDLLDQLLRREVKAGVVARSDHSHGNLKELLIAIDDKMTPAGVTYVALDLQIDTSTAMGHMMLQTAGMNAELWSNITSEKMSEMVESLRSDGVYWGTTPFGAVRAGDGTLEPDAGGCWVQGDAATGWQVMTTAGQQGEPPEPAAEWRGWHDALMACYEHYASPDGSYQSTANHLNHQGFHYQTRGGKARPWSYNDVRRALKLADTYAGNLTRGAAARAQPQELIEEGAWEPIVPLDLIHKARRRMDKRKKPYTPRKGDQVYPLTPLLYCRDCKAQLVGGAARHNGHRVYRHHRKG